MITCSHAPHSESHPVAALNGTGTTRPSLAVSNDVADRTRLHQFACSLPKRYWAVEDAANRHILTFVRELRDLNWVLVVPRWSQDADAAPITILAEG